MPAGLELYDASGNLIVGLSTRTGFIIDRVDISTGNQSGNVTNAALANGTPFAFITAGLFQGNTYPNVSFSGTTMTWTPSGGGGFTGSIFYGVW